MLWFLTCGHKLLFHFLIFLRKIFINEWWRFNFFASDNLQSLYATIWAFSNRDNCLLVLYNIWHGFLVRSLWPRMLWQAIRLWLVNRGMTAHHGKWVQALAPPAPGRRYGTRRSPLSEYMSLHLSLKLTTNCGPFSRIKWETYFYKEVFHSFIMFDYYTTLAITKGLITN